MKKPWKENGMSYFTDAKGRRVCKGAQMGRRSILPDDPSAPIRLRMEKLRFVDGDYDEGGAYWGGGRGTDDLYCAFYDGAGENVEVYVRARSRELAKVAVRRAVPGARFYR